MGRGRRANPRHAMLRLILMGLFIILVAAHERLERKHELMLECYMESSYSLTECITLITIVNTNIR